MFNISNIVLCISQEIANLQFSMICNIEQNRKRNFPRLNIALFILQQILQSHPFLMYKWIMSIFAVEGNSGTRFVAPLYYLK